MAKKKGYGYSPQYASIQLPDKIRCGRCQKWKAQPSFSQKQLLDAKTIVGQQGPNAPFKINCRTCAGGPIMELECVWCNQTKGLEEFAKSQRAKRDTAKCMACVEKQLELEPVMDERYEDPRGAHDAEDWTTGPNPCYFDPSTTSSATTVSGDVDDATDSGGVSLHNSMHNLDITDSSASVDTDGFGYESYGGDNDGWTQAKAKSWNSKAELSSQTTFSGFNPNKYGHPGNKSGASASGTSRSFSSKATGGGSQSEVRKKGNWAKIPAYKAPKPVSDDEEEDDDWNSDHGGDDDSDSGSDRSL